MPSNTKLPAKPPDSSSTAKGAPSKQAPAGPPKKGAVVVNAKAKKGGTMNLSVKVNKVVQQNTGPRYRKPQAV